MSIIFVDEVFKSSSFVTLAMMNKPEQSVLSQIIEYASKNGEWVYHVINELLAVSAVKPLKTGGVLLFEGVIKGHENKYPCPYVFDNSIELLRGFIEFSKGFEIIIDRNKCFKDVTPTFEKYANSRELTELKSENSLTNFAHQLYSIYFHLNEIKKN